MGWWESTCSAEAQEAWIWSLGWKDPLEESMATYSSILAWEIPWTEEPAGLQSMGSQRVRHDWSDLAHTHAYMRRPKEEWVTPWVTYLKYHLPLKTKEKGVCVCVCVWSGGYVKLPGKEQYKQERGRFVRLKIVPSPLSFLWFKVVLLFLVQWKR